MGKVAVQVQGKEKFLGETITRFEDIGELNIGSFFGDLSTMKGNRYLLTYILYIYRVIRIIAKENCYFAVIRHATFEKILKMKEEKRIRVIIDFLLNNPYFKMCHSRNLYHIHYYFHERNFTKGQLLCKQGDAVNYLYLVKEGELEVE